MSKEAEKLSLPSSEEQPMEVDEMELISNDSEPMEVEEIEVFAAAYFLWLVCRAVCFLVVFEEKQQIPTKSTNSEEPSTKKKKATKAKEVVSEDKPNYTEPSEITETQNEIPEIIGESNGPKKDQGNKNTKTPLENNGGETAHSDNPPEESKENIHKESYEELQESMEVEEVEESMEIDETYPFVDNQRNCRNKRKAEVIQYETFKKQKLE